MIMKKFAMALVLGSGLVAAGVANADTVDSYNFVFSYPVLNGTGIGTPTIVDRTAYYSAYDFLGTRGRTVEVSALQSSDSFASSTSALVYQGTYGLGVFSTGETKLSQPSHGGYGDTFSSTYIDSVGQGERLCFDFGTVGGNQLIKTVTFSFADATDRAVVGVYAGTDALAPLATFSLGGSAGDYSIQFVPPLATTKFYIGAIDSGTQHSSFTVERFNVAVSGADVSTVPLPHSLWAGLGLLACVGLVGLRRKLPS